MITLQGINKTFQVAKQQVGFGHAVKALYIYKVEEHSEGMTILAMREGCLATTLDPPILLVPDASVSLATQTELTDVAVSGITAEEMAAALYRGYIM